MPNITPPPVPTQSQMTNTQGLVSRPWLSWFTTLGQIFGFNQTIQAAGVAVPQEVALNFAAGFTVTDNASNGSTDVSVAAPPLVQGAVPNLMGVVYENTSGYDKFVTVVAFTGQAVGSNSAFALQVGDAARTLAQVSVGNVTHGPGFATVSSIVPAGSFYMVYGIYGTLAIVANGWQEFSR